MKFAIIGRNHGRKGAKLQPLKESILTLRSVAKYFKCSPDYLEQKFIKCGCNVFNPTWKEFIEQIHNRK